MVGINLENTVQVVLLEQGEGGVRARGGGGAGRGRGGGVRGGALVGQLPRARDARTGEAHARRGRARLQLCILRRVNTRIYRQSLCLLTSNLMIEDVLRYLAGVPQPVPEAPVPGVAAPAAAPSLLLSTCHARQEVGKLNRYINIIRRLHLVTALISR